MPRPIWKTRRRSISQRRAQAAQLKLTTALEQLAEKAATEHGKRVGLVTMGLEDIPEEWSGTLFDLLGQLVRNAVEHGIESSHVRVERGKPAIGTLVIEFVAHGPQGYELNVQDDGGGLDAERIVAAAIKLGLLAPEAAPALAPVRLISFMFHPGLTTAPPRTGEPVTALAWRSCAITCSALAASCNLRPSAGASRAIEWLCLHCWALSAAADLRTESQRPRRAHRPRCTGLTAATEAVGTD